MFTLVQCKEKIKSNWVFVSILFGLLTFVGTAIFLNGQVELPKGDIIIRQSKNTYYVAGPHFAGDTLYTNANINGTIPKKDLYYNRYPSLLLWIFLVSTLTGIGFCLLPFYYTKIKAFNGKWPDFVQALIFTCILFLGQFISKSTDKKYITMPQDVADVFGIGISRCGMVFYSTAPFIPLIFWITMLISMIKFVGNNKSDTKLVNHVRSSFEVYFSIVAVLLALSIFCNSLYAIVINSMLVSTGTFRVVPNEFAYINAVMYSFVLMITYATVYYYFKSLVQNVQVEAAGEDKAVTAFNPPKKFWDYILVILSMLAPILSSGLIDILKLIGT